MAVVWFLVRAIRAIIMIRAVTVPTTAAVVGVICQQGSGSINCCITLGNDGVVPILCIGQGEKVPGCPTNGADNKAAFSALWADRPQRYGLLIFLIRIKAVTNDFFTADKVGIDSLWSALHSFPYLFLILKIGIHI